MTDVNARIVELGYTLPHVSAPKGNYKLLTRVGNVLYTAGHIPTPANGDLITGKVGQEVTAEQAYDAAHIVALAILATLKNELGDLNKIKQIVKLTGFVNCVDGFTAQPSVINGASDTFAKVFGDSGVGARSAIGTNALPFNVPVEIEAIVELKSDA